MKKESKVNQAKYVELNLFPEEKEDHQKDPISSEDMESETSPDKEYDLTDLFERLSKSAFRNTKVSENSDMAKSWATFCCSGTYK